MEFIVRENYDALCWETSELIINKLIHCSSPLVCFATGDTSLGILKKLSQAHKENRINFGKARFVGLDEWVGMNGLDSGSCRHTLDQYFFNPLGICRWSRILHP